jgi:hypothetical protein
VEIFFQPPKGSEKVVYHFTAAIDDDLSGNEKRNRAIDPSISQSLVERCPTIFQ